MLDSLTVWSERPEFGVYQSLQGLPKKVASVLIVAVVDRLGYTLDTVTEGNLTQILHICTSFADRVYGETPVSRGVALASIPDDEIGRAFLAVDRLVQPNGFP